MAETENSPLTVDQPVWIPDLAPWADDRGARVDIDDRRLRLLTTHHLAQAGSFRAGPCHVTIDVLSSSVAPRAHRVYVARSNVDICDFAAAAHLAAPIGLAAIADLDDLPTIVAGVLGGVSSQGAVAAAVVAAARSMSRRSLEILELVSTGRTNREIARELNFSLTTIKRDLMGLFETFGCDSRRELVRRAADAGLVAPSWGPAVRAHEPHWRDDIAL